MSQVPLRPALPLLLFPLVSCWLGIMLAVELTYQQVYLHVALPFVGVGISAGVGYARFRKTRVLSIPALTILAFMLALSLGNCHYQKLSEQAQNCQNLAGEQLMTVIEDTRTSSNSRATEVFIVDQEDSEIRLRAFWNDQSLSLPKGTRILARVTVTPLKNNQRWLFEKGVVGSLKLSDIKVMGYADTPWGALDSFRASNVEKIRQLSTDENGALLAGVLLGHREGLQGSEAEQDFISCGLSHLIAVSGSHLAVVAALLSWCLRRLPLPHLAEITVLLLVLCCYVMLTGLQPSAIRSAIMAGVGGCSVLIGRRGHAPSALCAAAVLMLLLYPPNAYSIGFWLSVCAVLGITLFAHLVTHWVHTAAPLRSKQKPGTLSSSLALTLTAASATLPLAVPVFAVLSLVGPLANLLVAPLVSIMLVLGMLALVIPGVLEPLSQMLITCALAFSELSVWIAAKLSMLPFASIPLHASSLAALCIGALLAAMLYIFWPSFKAKTLRLTGVLGLVVAFAMVCCLPYTTPPRLTVMDVGQGDALLIQEQDTAILIDTGASESMLTRALARNNVQHLDAVIITHLDDDHAGALKRLRGLVSVDQVYVARGLLKSQGDDRYIREAYKLVGKQAVCELGQGDLISLGNTLALEVLWPMEEAQEGSNEESICLVLTYDQDSDGTAEQQALLTGDAEESVLAALLNKNPRLKASLIKVGHHGSKGAVSLKQLQQLSSSIALISVGADNRYGHPSAELLAILNEAEVQTLRTDEAGDITCAFTGATVELSYATMANELH